MVFGPDDAVELAELAVVFTPTGSANLYTDPGLGGRVEAQRGNAAGPVVVLANLKHAGMKLPVAGDRQAGAGRLGRRWFGGGRPEQLGGSRAAELQLHNRSPVAARPEARFR